MSSENSQPGAEQPSAAANGRGRAVNRGIGVEPEVEQPIRPGARQPKRPRPAPVGPDGQPLLVREGSHGRGLIIAIALVLGLAAWILWNAARAATETPDKVKLGTDIIEVSRNPAELAKRIERDGPRLYPGLAGTEADFWLNTVNGQWFAFAARPAETGRECNSVWRPDQGQFEDGCVPGKLYGPTGEGLPPYDAFSEGEADNGRVYVRLQPPSGP